jgi:large subunit ribosomal protein L10
MTREEKAAIIEDLVGKFNANTHFYVTDAGGMTVERVNELRRTCYKKGVEYKVYKNTLIAKALERMDADYSKFNEGVLKGFSGIIFSKEDGKLPAEIIKEFRTKYKAEKPLLKGASIDSDLFIGDDQLDTLTKLKSKAELIGEVITLLQSPAYNVIGALQSGKHKLAGIVKTLSERES